MFKTILKVILFLIILMSLFIILFCILDTFYKTKFIKCEQIQFLPILIVLEILLDPDEF